MATSGTRIALFDTNQRKFTQDMIDHWERCGHEVRYFNTLRRPHIKWANVCWFDCVDGNLIAATKKIPKEFEGKKIIARAIDIDVWANHFAGVDWNKVDHLIFIAKHIQDRMLVEKKGLAKATTPPKVHLIPCGVDLDRFTLRRDPVQNNNVAVVMRLWHGKGIDLLLQIIAAFPAFHFHICGKWGLNKVEDWYRKYIAQFLSHYDNWTHVEHVEDMNEWLEDKTYTLLCSKKEALSYAMAEGAAKGLCPLVHAFYGVEQIWPPYWTWYTLADIRGLLGNEYLPVYYRGYVERRYPLSIMLRRFDEILAD